MFKQRFLDKTKTNKKIKKQICDAAHWKGGLEAESFLRYKWKHSDNNKENKNFWSFFNCKMWIAFRRGRSRMGEGGTYEKKSNWSRNCPPNAKLGLFCYFKHEIQLFKVLLSLKVVKFDTKMYLNFSNFWGWTSAGGSSLGPKMGTRVRWGDWQNFCWMGDPISPPPGKKRTLPKSWMKMVPQNCFGKWNS